MEARQFPDSTPDVLSRVDLSATGDRCEVRLTDTEGWWSAAIHADGEYDITFYWPTNLANRTPGGRSPEDVNIKGSDFDRFIQIVAHIWEVANAELESGLMQIKDAWDSRSQDLEEETYLAENPPEPDPEDALIEKCARILGAGNRNPFGYLEFMASCYGIPLTQDADVVRAFHPDPASEVRATSKIKDDILKAIYDNPLPELVAVIHGQSA